MSSYLLPIDIGGLSLTVFKSLPKHMIVSVSPAPERRQLERICSLIIHIHNNSLRRMAKTHLMDESRMKRKECPVQRIGLHVKSMQLIKLFGYLFANLS